MFIESIILIIFHNLIIVVTKLLLIYHFAFITMYNIYYCLVFKSLFFVNILKEILNIIPIFLLGLFRRAFQARLNIIPIIILQSYIKSLSLITNDDFAIIIILITISDNSLYFNHNI